MTKKYDYDVIVVGAGPTGMTLALSLARGGVKTLAFDKEADVYPLPRAAHVDHEIANHGQTRQRAQHQRAATFAIFQCFRDRRDTRQSVFTIDAHAIRTTYSFSTRSSVRD